MASKISSHLSAPRTIHHIMRQAIHHNMRQAIHHTMKSNNSSHYGVELAPLILFIRAGINFHIVNVS